MSLNELLISRKMFNGLLWGIIGILILLLAVIVGPMWGAWGTDTFWKEIYNGSWKKLFKKDKKK